MPASAPSRRRLRGGFAKTGPFDVVQGNPQSVDRAVPVGEHSRVERNLLLIVERVQYLELEVRLHRPPHRNRVIDAEVADTVAGERAAPELAKKEEIIIFTKTDILPEKEILRKITAFEKEFKKTKKEVYSVTIYDDNSVKELKDNLVKILRAQK